MDVFDRDCRQIDVGKATNVHAPFFRSCSRAAKREYPAHGTEVILRDPGIPLIDLKICDWCKKSQRAFIDTMNERASSAAYGAVTNTDVVNVRIYLKLHFAAVAATEIGLSQSQIEDIRFGSEGDIEPEKPVDVPDLGIGV